MRDGAQTVNLAKCNVLFGVGIGFEYERSFMSDIFAMQRANGDWFALDHHGGVRVPLFHSIHDAMMARLHNFGLLLFNPVVVDAVFLKKIAPLPGEDAVDFCMVDDPFASLNSGSIVGRRDLALLIRPDEHQSIEAVETWEDEGGKSASVRNVRERPLSPSSV